MRVELKVIAGPHEGRSFHFDEHDTFLVGRGPQSHFRLPKKDTFFSRLHFMVEVNPPYCRLTDLDSTNGTQVNKQRVDQADLKDGDVIRGGKTHIRVRVHTDDIRVTRRQTGPVGTRASNETSTPAVAIDACSQKETPAIEGGAAAASVTRIGRYELVREIGRGGMGVVHLARHTHSRELVALKTIRPDVEVSQRDIELFLREAKVLQALDHPGIIRFLEIGEDGGQLFFAMEYFPAPNAAECLAEGVLSIPVAVSIACRVLEALEYAHEMRYIHRDIKPENILVECTSDPIAVKVADFGLARVYETSRMSGITMQGEIDGSIAFAPPEHLTNYRNAAPAGDLYSVGATLYTLLTGALIYDFPDSIAKAVLTVLQTDPVPIQSRRSDIPESLVAIVHKALHRDPSDRYASASEMRTALRSAATG